MYPGHLRSLSGYLSYFLLFLRMAEYHKGRTFKSCRMVYAKNKIIPDTPIIEKVTACTYRVNDILANCYYIIEFEDTTNVNVSFSPFDWYLHTRHKVKSRLRLALQELFYSPFTSEKWWWPHPHFQLVAWWSAKALTNFVRRMNRHVAPQLSHLITYL